LIPPLAAKLREADGILNVPVTSQKALPISLNFISIYLLG
jgi:hypothetical protein